MCPCVHRVQQQKEDPNDVCGGQAELIKMGLKGNAIMVAVDIVFIVCFFPGSFFLELFCG